MNPLLIKLKRLVDLRSELDVESASATIRKNIHFNGINTWILACAIVIASLGLNVNSTAVIIGAMLISPLMGPIIGFGLSVGTDDMQLMKSSLKNLGVMVAISIVVSTLFFLISPLNMQHPSELLARTNPTIYDVLIAFVGGAAGALETSRKEKGTVISGVAIATALMPPLCTVGYGLSNLDMHIALGAFYLFFINCVFVALATFLVVKYLRYPKVSHIDGAVGRRARMLTTLFLIILIIPSVFSAVTVVRENNFNMRADSFVEASKNLIDGSVIYDHKTDPHTKPATVTIYLIGNRLSDTDKETLFSFAENGYRIDRHQIQFETAFTSANSSEFEKEVYSSMVENVSSLQKEIRRYESEKLPHAQINTEAKALFPSIDSLSLARGENSVYAIVSADDTTFKAVSEQLGKWLEARLNGERVKVINHLQ